ncbi:MAG: hypothetical protein QNJ34_07980 [Xenococcaceae cyanobacterium MO_188.B29]|nr:hypothetical protein [Xenococcaceae cyanobacterium MO_188.B29]
MFGLDKTLILDKNQQPIAVQIPIAEFKQIEEILNFGLKNFNFNKKRLIDYAYGCCQPVPTSFADLGGIWNVDGAYTLYTLHKYGAKSAFLVDTNFTDTFHKKSRSEDSLKLIQGNFGEKSVAEQIGKVDAIFLFDVLLHQVKPDWNEILEIYSKHTNYFLVYNQQWIGSENTVRLIDLGRDEYLKNTPHTEESPNCKAVFEKMNEIHPQHKRIWRDIHNVWQWGITDRDLLRHMENLGFKMQWYKNFGRFASLPNFENHAFVFQKI